MIPDDLFPFTGQLNSVGKVAAALTDKDYGLADALARQGLLAGVEAPLLLNVAAFGLEREGRLDAALRLLERARELHPEDNLTLTSLGHWHCKTGRPGLALGFFEQVLAQDTHNASAHHGQGLALAAMRDFPGARASQERALLLDPDNPDVLSALAGVTANLGDTVMACRFAEQALRLDPTQSAAAVALGALAFQAGDMDAVVSNMREVIARGGMTGLHASSAHRLLADALAAKGDAEAAFGAYSEANGILRAVHAATFDHPGVERGVELCRRLNAVFSRIAPAGWSAPEAVLPVHPAEGHVFLVGFPRSGTTLLEQVLATHPQVVALEERATLGEAGLDFFAPDTIDRLLHMDAATADQERKAYWERVREFGVDVTGKVFVDKHPLNTLWLPYMAKLFPDARVLFALRDPRDVVLSCFRRRFLMNGAMYNFTDLAETANFYSETMALSNIYRKMLSLRWYDHRHEDLVQDFPAETRRLCDFLDLPWTETLETFAETAKRRDVQTPSAPQVRRGLYREGMGQWRAYGEGMAHVMPVLAPWVERFGYPAQ